MSHIFLNPKSGIQPQNGPRRHFNSVALDTIIIIMIYLGFFYAIGIDYYIIGTLLLVSGTILTFGSFGPSIIIKYNK